MKLSKNIKTNLLSYVLFFLLFLLIKTNFTAAQEDNLNVLNRWIEWSDGGNMLIRHLNKQAFTYLDIRDREISKLNTKADWMKRQEKQMERKRMDIQVKDIYNLTEEQILELTYGDWIQNVGFLNTQKKINIIKFFLLYIRTVAKRKSDKG